MYDPYGYGYARRRRPLYTPTDPLAEVIEAEIEVELVEDLIFDNDQDFGGGFDPF